VKTMIQQRECIEHVQRGQGYGCRGTRRMSDTRLFTDKTSRGFKMERGTDGFEVKGVEGQEWNASKHGTTAALEAGRQ
jgi:hypothetical protein